MIPMEEDKDFLRQDSDYRTLKAFRKAECIYDVTTTNQELKALFDLLERAGMNPQLCDTPVRYYENCVPAGNLANLTI